MEIISYENLVSRLVETVPEVPLDPDAVADNLAYFVLNDLMRFVSSTVETEENRDLLMRIFCFIEVAARTKDSQIEDVLQDALYELAVSPTEKSDSLKICMGPTTRKLFRKVEAQIYQK